MTDEKRTDEKRVVFRVVDLETTGFEGAASELPPEERDGVVEIAAVDVDAAGNVVAERQDLVHPGRGIPPTASAIHHLVDADVANAESFDVVWPHYYPRDGVVMVAHNAAFDAAFIGEDPTRWVCTYRLASHLWPDAPGHGNQVLRYWTGVDVPGAQGKAAHRALADAHVTAALLCPLLLDEAGRQGVSGLGELLELCWSPIIQTVCRFGKYRGQRWEDVPMDYLSWIRRQGERNWDPDVWATVDHHVKRRLDRA